MCLCGSAVGVAGPTAAVLYRRRTLLAPGIPPRYCRGEGRGSHAYWVREFVMGLTVMMLMVVGGVGGQNKGGRGGDGISRLGTYRAWPKLHEEASFKVEVNG